MNLLTRTSARPHTARLFLLVALAQALTMSTACVSLPTTREAGVSYAAVPSTWPTNAACLNSQNPTVAKEVLVGRVRTVVVAGGPRPISDADWATYTPSIGNQKNSDRHLLFSGSCFARSPEEPASCRGDACRTVIELDGHTWVALSKIDAVDCIPDDGACAAATLQHLAPGHLAVVVTEKCHELRFTGDVIFLDGPHGERAIMHATADGNPTTDVALPAGWTLTRETLVQELVLHPFGDGDRCFYNILRDARAQSYHQMRNAQGRYP